MPHDFCKAGEKKQQKYVNIGEFSFCYWLNNWAGLLVQNETVNMQYNCMYIHVLYDGSKGKVSGDFAGIY